MHIAEVTLLICDVVTAAARFAMVVVELFTIVRCVLFIIGFSRGSSNTLILLLAACQSCKLQTTKVKGSTLGSLSDIRDKQRGAETLS